jgi:hypothetical protein
MIMRSLLKPSTTQTAAFAVFHQGRIAHPPYASKTQSHECQNLDLDDLQGSIGFGFGCGFGCGFGLGSGFA